MLVKQMKRVDKLRWTHSSKRKATWKKDMQQLILDLDNGLDLRSDSQTTIDFLTDELNIEVGPDEELLYLDNCVPREDGLCNMKVVVAGDD